MALTNLQLLRLRAADKAREFSENFTGDGVRKVFHFTDYPIEADSEAITINGTAQTDPTNYSINDDTGRITFVSAPADKGIILVIARGVIWSDTELNDILSRNANNIRDCVLECLEAMMVDYSRRAKWSAAQGLGVDESASFRNVEAAFKAIKERQTESAFADAGLESWAVNQEDYL